MNKPKVILLIVTFALLATLLTLNSYGGPEFGNCLVPNEAFILSVEKNSNVDIPPEDEIFLLSLKFRVDGVQDGVLLVTLVDHAQPLSNAAAAFLEQLITNVMSITEDEYQLFERTGCGEGA